jgi:hypothetical protein
MIVSLRFYFFLIFCLRRLTFFQQQKKVSKKCRPSGAGEANFPQIATGDVPDAVANVGWCFFKVKVRLEIRGKSMVVLGDGVCVQCCFCFEWNIERLIS